MSLLDDKTMRLKDCKAMRLRGVRPSEVSPAKRGFSLIELLMVIAVMAVIATLTIGGVTKSIQASREKRVDTMCDSLRLALITYRAQEGRWPCRLDPGTKNGTQIADSDDPADVTMNRVVYSREENRKVFAPLIPQRGTKKGYYISTAEFLTKIGGEGVIPLREAVDKGISQPPLGYANPKNQSEFMYFRVEFNLLTDSVVVQRQRGLGGRMDDD